MTNNRLSSLLFLAPSAALAACGGMTDHHYFHRTEQSHAAEWGYEGAIGPAHWGDLAPDYALAKSGRAQSPIDIQDATAKDLPPIAFDYRPAQIDLVYNGHTIEEKEDGTSSITVDGKNYTLRQFHFHSPSEHTVDGHHAAMEMHLVHKSADGEVAVVGVLIEAGAENAAFAPVWGHLPTATNRTRKAKTTIDVAAMLPADRSYYAYRGSFTTPPCTEGVRWMVLRTPVQLSSEQIASFRATIDGNNRPVQARNGRNLAVSR